MRAAVAPSKIELPIRREDIIQQIEDRWPDKLQVGYYLAGFLDSWTWRKAPPNPWRDFLQHFTTMGVSIGLATEPEQCIVALEKAMYDISFPINF